MQNLFRFIAVLLAATFATVTVTGCAPTNNEVTVVVHDSVSISSELLQSFKAQTGITVKLVKAGDAGAMTNKLVLTKDQPIGDVVYGIDNTFASLANDNKIIDGELTAIDFGDVCFNYDKTWFALHEQAAPTSIDDLIDTRFANLTVLQNPNTSSTGLSFLAATVDKYGEKGWQAYWTALKNNGVKVVSGWEDAYYTQFSGSSGKGDYPIVLSYSSSPAFEVRSDGESQTASILDGCFRQTEFAGVLTEAKNKAGAQAFIKFLLSPGFQASIPESMYMYPISKIQLPANWSQFAPTAPAPLGGRLDISTNRDKWLKAWTALFD